VLCSILLRRFLAETAVKTSANSWLACCNLNLIFKVVLTIADLNDDERTPDMANEFMALHIMVQIQSLVVQSSDKGMKSAGNITFRVLANYWPLLQP